MPHQIGQTNVASFTTVDGVRRFDIPADFDLRHVEAHLLLAEDENKAILARVAELRGGSITRQTAQEIAELDTRNNLILDYRRALLAERAALIEAAATDPAGIDPAAVSDPDPEPEPAPAPDPEPAPAAAEREPVHAALQPDLIVDAAGNRYQRVGNPADAAHAMTPAQVVAAAGGNRLPSPHTGAGEIPVARRPMLAAVGSLLEGQLDSSDQELTPAQVGQRLMRFAGTRANERSRQLLWRQDRLAGTGIERLPLGRNDAQAEAILASQRGNREAMLAALCGPAELNRDFPVTANTERVLPQLFGSPIAVGVGIHEFFRAVGLQDLYAHFTANATAKKGVMALDSAYIDAIDATDPDTWKEYFTLPACQGTVCVSVYWLTRFMRVKTSDQMSRPAYVEAMGQLLEAMMARLGEYMILESIDTWSARRTFANVPGYGALNQLYHMVKVLKAWASQYPREDLETGGYALVVPQPLLEIVDLDAFHAASRTGVPTTTGTAMLQEIFQPLGIRVQPTLDWGAEGATMPAFPVSVDPTGAADPGNGSALPALPTVHTVRLIPADDYQWGTVGVFDFVAETSPELKLRNEIQIGGETAEICYKTGSRPSFAVTLSGVIPNGSRPDWVTPYTHGANNPSALLPGAMPVVKLDGSSNPIAQGADGSLPEALVGSC